jgi:hypothetical protein
MNVGPECFARQFVLTLPDDSTGSFQRENDSFRLNDKFDNDSPLVPTDFDELRQKPFATTKNPLDP